MEWSIEKFLEFFNKIKNETQVYEKKNNQMSQVPMKLYWRFHKQRVKTFIQKIIPKKIFLGMLFFYHPDALLIKLCNISAVGCKYLVLIVFCVSPNKRAT